MLPLTYQANDDQFVIACVDEVGRGCLAGPVCAAAVIWPKDFNPTDQEDIKLANMVKDSKKVTPKNREKLTEFIRKHAVAYAVAFVDNKEIDKINILQATYKAMHDALDNLSTEFDKIYVDGDKFKTYMSRSGEFVPHTCIVEGDNTLFQIAAASILAKTTRDAYITELTNTSDTLKHYGWEKNKGYGTKAHFDALKKHGLSEYHRKTFVHL